MNIGGEIYDRALAAMNDFIDRVARAQRMSGVRESVVLKLVRDEFRNVSAPGAKRYVEAWGILSRFTSAAQNYYERARTNPTHTKRWTQYEDQRLRKSVARLTRVLAESQKWEAMRRLQSPSSKHNFIKFNNGDEVKLTDMRDAPIYDTFRLSPKSAPSLDHDVLVAAGFYRKS